MASLKFIMDSSDEDASGPMNKRPALGSVPDPAHQDPSRSASTSHANDPSHHRHSAPDDDDNGDGHHRRHQHQQHHHHHRDDSNISLRAAAAAAATLPATSLGTRPRPSPSPSSTSSPAIPPPSPNQTGSSSAHPAPPGRRQSTASIESMDPNSAYGASGRASSSSAANMPMRPMSGHTREDVQVKLTPITGRVSRAKKGVPVHICEECNPPKTFTRAEHLRRHRLSHGTPQFPCMHPGCDKAFHRADLLARHSQRHNEHDDQGSPGATDGSRSTPMTMKDQPYGQTNPLPRGASGMGDGAGTQATMPSTQSGPGPSYPHDSYGPPGRQVPSGDRQQQSHHHHHHHHQQNQLSPQGSSQRNPQVFEPTTGTYILGATSSPVVNGNAPEYGVAAAFAPRTPEPLLYLGDGLNLTIPDVPGLLPTHDTSSPWPSSEASESAFSTPPSEGGPRGTAAAGRHLIPQGYTSPASDWNPHLMSPYTPVTSHGMQSPGNIDAIAMPSFFHPFSPPVSHASNGFAPQTLMEMSIGQLPEEPVIEHPFPIVRSLTPATMSSSAQPAESLVTVSATGVPHAASPSLLSRHKSPAAISVGPLGIATCSAALDNIPRAARLAIPHYLDTYWKHFDPLFPLVHRPTFETAGDDVLRCAMAAIATQYLPDREARARGAELHEFASREVQYRVQLHGLETMQAILLCEFYARFRGRKAANRPSALFQRIYSTVLNQQHTYDRGNSLAIREGCWKGWVQAAAHRRFLACCFTLDVHGSMYHEQGLVNPSSTPTSNVPFQRGTEGLWEARTSEEWQSELVKFDQSQPKTLAEETISPERVNTAPALDRAVMLASEVLRLPRREKPSLLDLSAPVDLLATSRITSLFAENPVAYTYSALYYTPLHDLLAVSGDSWVFTQKVRSSQKYLEHQRNFKAWCNSQYLGAAGALASKALLAFISPDRNTGAYGSAFSEFAGSMANEEVPNDCTQGRGLEMLQGTPGLGIFGVDVALGQDDVAVEENHDWAWNMSNISDYWAMHVCALVLWAIGQRPVPGRGLSASVGAPSTPSSASPRTYNSRQDFHNRESINISTDEGDVECKALQWLQTVSQLRPDEISNMGDHQEQSLQVVTLVRRRLESEATAGHRSRLLVDSLSVLRSLERGTNLQRS